MEKHIQVEKSITKKYHKTIWCRFIEGIKEYDLIQENDRIAVCISGGKDSMLMAKCMQELLRHNKFHFELVFLVMDPGYNDVNRQTIVSNAALLNIPIHIFETKIFDIVADIDQSPCYLCARMRRGHLYKNAQELGCNKIAVGHHFDDVVETVLMSMLYNGRIQTMMPKLHSTNYPGMELIRPMYCVREADILAWKNYNDLQFIQCACRFTENCTMCDNGGGGSKRQEMKTLIKRLRQMNGTFDKNIFHSLHNVNLDTVIAYKKGGELRHFLKDYDEAVQSEEI